MRQYSDNARLKLINLDQTLAAAIRGSYMATKYEYRWARQVHIHPETYRRRMGRTHHVVKVKVIPGVWRPYRIDTGTNSLCGLHPVTWEVSLGYTDPVSRTDDPKPNPF